MDVSARPAGESDSADLAALRRSAVEAVGGERGGALHLAVEHGSLRSASGGEGTGFTAVAEIEGVVVGYADAHLVPVPGTDADPTRMLCSVPAVYVEPAAREVGAGEALMEVVASWARQQGAIGIDVLALPGAREVKNFFESSGYVARLIVMHRPLDAGDERDQP